MLQRWRSAAQKIKNEIDVYRLVMKDPRTPRATRALLAAAAGYVLLPFDLIPDFIPLFGQMDDLIVVPLLVFIALKMVPPQVVDDCRLRAADLIRRNEKNTI